MKLLLENWRQYLNENEENEHGPEVQRIRDAVISGGALRYDDLSQSGLSDSEVFDMAFKLSRLEADQSMVLIDSLGYSPSVTEVITRVVVEILEAEKADLRGEWFKWFRNRESADPSLEQALNSEIWKIKARSRDFLAAMAKKRKGEEQ